MPVLDKLQQSPLPMMLMETAMMLLDDQEQFLLMETDKGTWRLPTEIVLEGERLEDAVVRYLHNHRTFTTSPPELIDMTMNVQSLKKVTALYCVHIQCNPTALKAFSFNALPENIERDTLDYLASYVAKRTV